MIIMKRKQSTAVKNEYILAVIYRKLYDASNDRYSNFGYKGRSIFLYLTHGPHPTSIYYSDLFKFQKYSNIILCKMVKHSGLLSLILLGNFPYMKI